VSGLKDYRWRTGRDGICWPVGKRGVNVIIARCLIPRIKLKLLRIGTRERDFTYKGTNLGVKIRNKYRHNGWRSIWILHQNTTFIKPNSIKA